MIKIDGKISEAVKIGLQLEAEMAAHTRLAIVRGAQRARAIALGKEPPPSLASGATRDRVAEAVGLKAAAYTRAKRVVEAALNEPARFGDLVEMMDASREIQPAYRELLARLNGSKTRPVALRRMHLRKPNREMQRAVDALGGICIVLREIPLDALDKEKLEGWGAALRSAMGTLSNIIREVKRHGQGNGNASGN